jgi:hypothetical protein
MAMATNREHLAERLDSAASLDTALLTQFDAGLSCAAERARRASQECGPEADVGTRFEAGLQAILEAAAAQPDLTRLCLVEVPGLGAGALERKEIGLQRFVDWLDEELATTPGAGRPTLVAEMVVGGIYEVLQHKARAGEIERLPRLGVELKELWSPVLRER